MTGKTHSKETKMKISETKKLKYKDGLHPISKTTWKKGHIPWNLGLTNSTDERLMKCSLKRTGQTRSLSVRKKMSLAKTGDREFVKFKSLLNRRIRRLPEMTTWRKNIFKRDNYICQNCGKKHCYIEAHHKERLAQLLYDNNITSLIQAKESEALWDINNGVTVCISCHNKTDIHRKLNMGDKNF